jgi:thiol-disulfide isomerase/thioredoxin
MRRLRPFFCFFLLSLLCFGSTTLSLAQLPDGSIAPDFTATDIQGVEHNLYDLLDDGKKVILEFSATWCPPCWVYHTNGVLDALYTDFGPNGTDELRIFFIESSDSPLNTLYVEGYSQGDWVSNTQYPIIDNGEAIFSDYQNNYWPTIYTICPNRILTESSQNSYEGHAAIFQANDCAADFVNGCVDPAACNYNPEAVEDDASCNYPGCQDPIASNYDSSAGCSGECIYLTYDCASIGDAGWAEEEIGLFPEWQQAVHGLAWEGQWVFNIPATLIEPESGVSYGLHHIEWSDVSGLPSWVVADYALAELDASSQHCIAASGIPSASGIHEVIASGEVFVSLFGQPFSIGYQSFSAWLTVLENPDPIVGCTYPLASNHLSYATADDGSCLFPGCTDPEAVNFSSIANVDDGSCGDGCATDPVSSCATDSNGDGQVNVTDLLALLAEFGNMCE